MYIFIIFTPFFYTVIPGPCGLYRSEDIFDSNVIGHYLNVMNVSVETLGLIYGNLRIVEDRVFAYSAILNNSQKNKRMSYVTCAVFYVDPILDMKKFLLQRRRWINGTIAGFLYLVNFSKSHFVNWKTSIIRKFSVFFLTYLQLFGCVSIMILSLIHI